MYYHSLKQCSSGTALHEAALFGKADVVNLLLHCGKLDTASLVHQSIMILCVVNFHTRSQTSSQGSQNSLIHTAHVHCTCRFSMCTRNY